ncbi:hypothetical protein DM02DRAFT_652872 [Periconia macrospinosa]|uniref:Cyanovirin-N domain-containing protein n=1 Tax=Periconia macrospinosa TaxID=97972 RepID=A0A2V1DY22_9PLEO|nr:hypothetical protein DM02DRAFT_652872 [Periconia macrospinosa]
MKFAVLVAAFAIQLSAAADTVKLNQYRSLDDCKNDRNILFHAAPISGTCYNIDSQTRGIFFNTGGFLSSRFYRNAGCNGESIGVSGAACIIRDEWNSFRLS